jgi:UDP-N-acetylmuramoyl-L-alanyl-D-glutamate--2,6-diaminopimelate ligase
MVSAKRNVVAKIRGFWSKSMVFIYLRREFKQFLHALHHSTSVWHPIKNPIFCYTQHMSLIKKLLYTFLPEAFLEHTLLPLYHRTLAFLGALWHGFAGRKLYIIAVTGTEGARLYRHEWIPLDAFIFTNLSPEHIERHGSFEEYRDAKLRIRDSLIQSKKKNKVVVSNKDDAHGALFMEVPEDITQLSYSLKQVEPYSTNTRVSLFTLEGRSIQTPLIGTFNISNMLACASLARHMGIDTQTIQRALEKLDHIPGRAQKIEEGQPYKVVVDYAHTAESLEALYKTFPQERKICVLGACGGGRDRWKRAKMAHVAETYCDDIIFTDEDPYDESPQQIIDDLTKGLEEKTPTIEMDRRSAIRLALSKAHERSAVLITGKGTDPYIMKARGEKMPWSDEQVVREELRKMREEEKIDEQHEKET